VTAAAADGDERLLRDMQAQRFVELECIYLDALALVTAFAEADGEPGQERLDEVLGHHDRQTQLALTASCRLSWQILIGLAGMIAVTNDRPFDTAGVWRSILEHRASHGWSEKPELFPSIPGWPT
jgi:hypothetical protein